MATGHARTRAVDLPLAVLLAAATAFLPLPLEAQATGTRAAQQRMDEDFAKAYAAWTSEPRYGSPLVDHLPVVDGIPMPKDVLGYHIGAPKTLTYYADALRYYRALAAASPRVQIETIGRSDEGRELVVVWVSSEQNLANLAQNRANLARIADPRGQTEEQIRQVMAATRPHYHLMGGLHSGETGPSEMLMELAYRLATEDSPVISQIRDNVYVSITPVADPDGRDRNVDWFYWGLERAEQVAADSAAARDSAGGRGAAGRGGAAAGGRGAAAAAGRGGAPAGGAQAGGGRGGSTTGSVPYWGRYVYHDNNRDINLSQVSMRAITDWYFTAHPPIIHDLHESLALLYTYSGGPPQNPNLDPLLFGELRFFANWELSQMTKYGMPGVYTHAFMDGWSPGYLGSVAYNHNGMMKMYETQSGRDIDVDSLRKAIADSAAAAARPVVAAGEAAGRGAGGGAAADSAEAGRGAAPAAGRGGPPGGGRGSPIPTGRGGGQDREWYRGIQVPPNGVATFTRRNNTNYMQTGVLSALQLTSLFPQVVLENFWVRTRNSMEAGRNGPPHAYAFPVQREMTRVANLINVLRAQGIEVGRLTERATFGTDTLAAGSYLVKLDQPYGRLAKNLLERQDYPDADLRTYDDSGWSMGWAFDVTVRQIDDKSVLDAKTTLVERAPWEGRVTGTGSAGLAVAHYGSTNMITFRYRLRDLAMQITEEPFSANGVAFPAGSFVVSGDSTQLRTARTIADSLGLTATALAQPVTVRTHPGDAPRVAIYSQWNGTQELGWYRHAFDRFGIPFELIYKEQVVAGDLRGRYDVIVMAAQNISRTAVMAEPAERPQPYQQSEKYRFLGVYGSTADMSGGFGEPGVKAFETFLEGGGTLIAAGNAVRFPIDFGFARTVDTESPAGVNAQKPLLRAKIARMEHPVFYGHEDSIMPIKYVQGAQVFRVGSADEDRVLARYEGGARSVLSGMMEGADAITNRAFAIDVPNAHMGNGRVFMFANNPVYRWQNHGEFNMVFNAILNWNDHPRPAEPATDGDGGASARSRGR